MPVEVTGTMVPVEETGEMVPDEGTSMGLRCCKA